MKDGTASAYKPELDLDTGGSADPADEGDTGASQNVGDGQGEPQRRRRREDPNADKGYRAVLKALDRPVEDPDRRAAEGLRALARRRGGAARGHQSTACYRRFAFKLRAEIVERSFAHNLDRGGMRRTWLRPDAQAIAPRRRHKPIVARQLIGVRHPATVARDRGIFVCSRPGALVALGVSQSLQTFRDRIGLEGRKKPLLACGNIPQSWFEAPCPWSCGSRAPGPQPWVSRCRSPGPVCSSISR